MKKIIIFSLIISVTAGLVLAGYFLRQKQGLEGDSPTEPNQNLPNLPAQPKGGVLPVTRAGAISAGPVYNYFIKSSGEIILIQPDGQIFEVKNKEVNPLSASPIADLRKAEFASDGQKILVTFGTNRPQTSVFDIATKTWSPLLISSPSITWSPTGYKVAYFSEKDASQRLTTWDLGDTKAKPKELIKIHAQTQNLDLQWVETNTILFIEKGSVLTRNSLWSFDVNSQRLTPVLKDRPGLETLWGGKGNNYLLAFESSANNQTGGKLFLTNKQGGDPQFLRFATLASKCVFNEEAGKVGATSSKSMTQEFLTCAIPAQPLEDWYLPDDYYKRILTTSDGFYRMNLKDGVLKLLFSDLETGFDATILKVAGQKLFFVNRLDKKLYSLPFLTNSN